MDKALASMDMAKITAVMDKFESVFEDVDVKVGVMDNAFSAVTASQTPEDDVEALMKQVADEHALDFKMVAADAGTAPVAQAAGSASQEDALEKRLAALRSS